MYIYICKHIYIYIYIIFILYIYNDLITRSAFMSERNSVVVGSNLTQTNILWLLLKIV